MSELTKNITWNDVKDDPNAIKVLDHGFIVLKEVMGSDQTIAESARVSYGVGTKTVNDDRNLIRYLVRHSHSSPLEMAECRFLVKVPIFVWRQWIRHRTANVNELSARYSELPEEYFMPEKWRGQSTTNKQGGEEHIKYTSNTYGEYESVDIPMSAEDVAFDEYRNRLDSGVSRELARSCLPVSTYTMAYWKCDLHNILNFLRLRLDKHAQKEIRDYAEAMYKLIQPKFPLVVEAFEDYQRQAVTFSRMEMNALNHILQRHYGDSEDFKDCLEGELGKDWPSFHGLSKREENEFKAKFNFSTPK